LRIADELLAREVLDADQVKRLAQGLPLEDPAPASSTPLTDDAARRETPPRPAIVPSLQKPVGQE
jgi:hypothetical protein